MSDDRWYFSKEQLDNSPSRKHGIDADKELNYKQLAANLIHDMGSRKHLSVNQLCISTAMVYMHRFYVYHSFTHFQWNAIAMASLFLAAKVEEQTRKIEHIIKVGQWCMQKSNISFDLNSETYLNQVQELVMNENILLQTLGFDVAVKHPHAFIVEFSDKLKMNKDITKTMYGMASNSLHVTTMCVQYKPSVVACFCIHFVCKWSNHAIQWNGEITPWWTYIDSSVTPELLERMTEEFLADFDKSPPKLKNKVKELLRSQHMSSHHPFNTDRKPDTSESSLGTSGHSLLSISSSSTPSSSSSHHQKHQQSSTSNHNVSEPSRIHKPSTAQPNHHHQSSHPPANVSASSSSSVTNGGGVHINPNSTIASSQLIKSNSTVHVASSQQHQQQQRHPQHQQHHHHRHNVVPMLPGSSQQAHKILTSGAAHNSSKPKINPVTFGISTSNGSAAANILPANETAKPDRRKVLEIKLKPGAGVEQGPDCNATAAAIASISNHRSATDAAAKNIYPKVDPSKDCNRLATNSRSDIISNVIKELTMGKPNEKCNVIKTEPSSADSNDGLVSNGAATKPSRNHSIFSPSPPASQFSPIREPIIKRQVLSNDVQIKQESSSKPTNQRIRPGISHSETTPVAKNIEAVTGFDNVFKNTLIAVPSTAVASQPLTNIAKITRVVSLAPRLNDVTIKEEPCEIKTEPVEFSTFSVANNQPPLIPRLDDVSVKAEPRDIKTEPVEFLTFSVASNQPLLIPRLDVSVKAEPCEIKTEPVELSTISVTNSQPPLVPNSTENLAVRIDNLHTSGSAAGECSSTSHTHKKKKKHKEKDKRHKEKKRHKEDRHHHRSNEHSSREKERKEPGPIKITIPKEKLVDIPVKLKIKINRDQIVMPSTSEQVTKNDTAVKTSSEKASKSRKRKRESDHDRSSRKLPCDDVISQNGFTDCL